MTNVQCLILFKTCQRTDCKNAQDVMSKKEDLAAFDGDVVCINK